MKELSLDEYASIMEYDYVDFDNSNYYLHYLKENLININLLNFEPSYRNSSLYINYVYKNVCKIHIMKLPLVISVIKTKDDYFIICIQNDDNGDYKYYLFDQFDNMVEYLNTII